MNETERAAEDRFRALFAETCRPLLAYALRRVRDPADAADVVGETFVVAWRRLDAVPVGDEARLWLFGVARRMLGNQRRGELRRSHLVDRLREQMAEGVVADVFAGLDTSHVVLVAMARLEDDEREILRLISWEGLTPAEIAVVLHVPAGTARSRLYRARARLRDELQQLGWDGERSGVGGHVSSDGRALVQDLEGER